MTDKGNCIWICTKTKFKGMKRSGFLKKIGGLGLIPLFGLSSCKEADPQPGDQIKQELIAAWLRSEKITLVSILFVCMSRGL